MRFYYDEDADLAHLKDRMVGIIGYGNQGRAQALNLRDSGISVIVGTQKDETWDQALADEFNVFPVEKVAQQANILFLLVPDEVAAELFDSSIRAHMKPGKTLNFASGYNVAFGLLDLPKTIDVIMIAPRMLGEGVRDRYQKCEGFPSFIAVHQDITGHAKETVLALAKGIGSTRMGVMEVSMRDEAIMDLFTEQGLGPLMGRCLIASYQVLVDAGLPPEAVLLELYGSGELALTYQAMAEQGIAEQMQLHSLTSQYGSMTRSARVDMKPFMVHLNQVLKEIRDGTFMKEWREEMKKGYPTLKVLREGARHLPMLEIEEKVRTALRRVPRKESEIS